MKNWYVLQVYPGYEEQARSDIEKSIELSGLSESFGMILVPSVKAAGTFGLVEEKPASQQLFPGYLVVEMEPSDESFKLVVSCPRIIRFLGGKDPIALSKVEVDRIKGQISGDVVVSVEKHDFEIGKEVEIQSGPFSGFFGIVDEVDSANEKITVKVTIFGRLTPVELNFDQVRQ